MKELLLTLLLMAAIHAVSMQNSEMTEGTMRETTFDNRQPEILLPQGPLPTLASFSTIRIIMKFIANKVATSTPKASLPTTTSVVTNPPNEREVENTERSTIFDNKQLKTPTTERPLSSFVFSTDDMMQYIRREAAIAASRSLLTTTIPTTQISFDDQEADAMDWDTTSGNGQFKTVVLQRTDPPLTPEPFSALPSVSTNFSEMTKATTGATAPAIVAPFITTSTIAAPLTNTAWMYRPRTHRQRIHRRGIWGYNKRLTKSLPQRSTSSSTTKDVVTNGQLFQQVKNFHNKKFAVFKNLIDLGRILEL
uniref:DUF4794 domain-containing protein n=1 Tax=Glossina austeni TaxID=7395 RepID=A0A1A9VXB4_GLOAU